MADHTYDRGSSPDGTLRVKQTQFHGVETVTIDLLSGDSAANLTPDQARATALDLLKHANRLDPPKIQIGVAPAPGQADPGFSPSEVQAAYERGRRQGRYEMGG